MTIAESKYYSWLGRRNSSPKRWFPKTQRLWNGGSCRKEEVKLSTLGAQLYCPLCHPIWRVSNLWLQMVCKPRSRHNTRVCCKSTIQESPGTHLFPAVWPRGKSSKPTNLFGHLSGFCIRFADRARIAIWVYCLEIVSRVYIRDCFNGSKDDFKRITTTKGQPKCFVGQIIDMLLKRLFDTSHTLALFSFSTCAWITKERRWWILVMPETNASRFNFVRYKISGSFVSREM